MDGSQEIPAPLPPEAGVGTERNSREKVENAFNEAVNLMDTDPSVDEWTKKSVRDAKEKTIDQGRSTFTNEFKNHHTGEAYKQEEGIPVENLLAFLNKKIEGTSVNTPEWQKLINIAHILYRNSQPYFKLHHHEYPTVDETSQFGSRVHQEALFISQDARATGDKNSDWFKAIDTLNNRRELILPSLQSNIDEWGESGKPAEEEPVLEEPNPADEKIENRLNPDIDEYGESGKPAGEEPILEEPSPDEVPKTETPPFFGFDIINYEEALSKEAHLEARKSVTEDLRGGKWYKFWQWPRKIGMRLIEPAMVNFRKERLRKAIHSNNFSVGQLATLERFKEGRLISENQPGGERREEAQGNLKGLITEQILKPIIDGQITTPEQVQKLLADFVRKNLNDLQVQAVFGPGANDFGDVAEVFATDVLEQGLSLKAYMDAHQKTLQQMDQQIGINLDYARLGHMTDTRNYVDRAVAWAKKRQSENLARGARGLGFSGVILNPAVVGVAAALGVSGLMRSVGMAGRLAALPSFFIGGIAGGSVAGMRRYYELGWDRSQHAAERVSGAEKPGPKDKRREELEKRHYNIASVDQLINGGGQEEIPGGGVRKSVKELLALDLKIGTTNHDELAKRLFEIEQRLDLSSRLKKDLIDFQSAEGKQTGANELTKAAAMLRKTLQDAGADMQGLENNFKALWSTAFTENIKEQDESFQKYRRNESLKAAIFGGVAGMAAGALGSEVLVRTGRALGVMDWQAPSEFIRSFFEASKPPIAPPSIPDINTIKSMFPGINAAVDPNGHINVTGAIPPDAQAEMQRLGFTVNHGPDIAGATQTIIEQKPVLWTEHETNVNHREWYAYDRPGSQANELRQYNFKDGKSVILDLSKMEQGFQKGLNPNPISVQEVIKNGEAGFYVTTPDTPQDGIWIPDSADGVIDGKVRLDPDDMAHMIKTPNGQISNGELANLLINQKELQNYGDGSLATELNKRFNVFNIGKDQKFGFIEAGRMQARPDGNVLQVFATIRGLGPATETIGVPITVTGEPTPTFEIVPPPVPEVVPETEETPFIIPIPFAPRHPLEPLRKPGEPDRTQGTVEQVIQITPEDLAQITPEQLQETESWARNWTTGFVQLEAAETPEERKRILGTWTARAIKDRKLINDRYSGSLLPLASTGQEGVDWKKQTNPGMLTCQLTSAGNALRSLGAYNDSLHSEQAMLNTLGGQNYADSHPRGASTYDLEDQVLAITPGIRFRGSNSVYEILEAVEKGAAVIIPLDPTHVGTILPGQRIIRSTTGELQVQVVDPLGGVRLIPVENLIKSDIVLSWDPRYSMGIIIEKTTPPASENLEAAVGVERSVISGVGFSETQGRRSEMEDAHTMIENNFGGKLNQAFFGIYDGHGGREVADFVADRLHKNYLLAINSGIDPKQAFKSAYDATEKQVKDAGIGSKSGTTAVNAFLQNKQLYVANAGDARAVLVRGNQAYRLSFDDKPGDPHVRARIETAGGQVSGGKVPRVEGQLAVARAFGDFDLGKYVPAEPHRTMIPLQPQDSHLILACDGVWDVIKDEDIVGLIGNEPDSQKASEILKNEAFNRGSGDNISVMVIKLNVSGSPAEIQSPVSRPPQADLTAENLQAQVPTRQDFEMPFNEWAARERQRNPGASSAELVARHKLTVVQAMRQGLTIPGFNQTRYSELFRSAPVQPPPPQPRTARSGIRERLRNIVQGLRPANQPQQSTNEARLAEVRRNRLGQTPEQIKEAAIQAMMQDLGISREDAIRRINQGRF